MYILNSITDMYIPVGLSVIRTEDIFNPMADICNWIEDIFNSNMNNNMNRNSNNGYVHIRNWTIKYIK